MAKKLFLLDGMALVYRAHFALIARPIFTSAGVNTSALYGFTQTLLEILNSQRPTHLAVAFDTDAPTQRHVEFPQYKIQREAMPEDLRRALPHVQRMIEAFRIPVLTCDGFEADDIIGTIVKRAEPQGFESFMVTSDKDFGQLVTEHTFLFKPGRMGDSAEILGPREIQEKWGIARPEQVIDVLALTGDSVDNVPGVPGIGEKTASKLLSQFGSLENLLNSTSELKGKIKESLEKHRDQATLSKRLVTIDCHVPLNLNFDSFLVREPIQDQLRELCVEFEFNSIGRRLFGNAFKAGRGLASPPPEPDAATGASTDAEPGEETASDTAPETEPVQAVLKTLQQVAHDYRLAASASEREGLVEQIRRQQSLALAVEASSVDPKQARLLGLAFSLGAGTAYYVPLPDGERARTEMLAEFREVLENPQIQKNGHDLKFDLSVLRWHGIICRGTLFDTMLAHALVEPDRRHSLEALAETFLGYTPIRVTQELRDQKAGQMSMAELRLDHLAEAAMEKTDLVWKLRPILEPKLQEFGQQRVYEEIEAPLLPVLVEVEFEGIRVDPQALWEFSEQLAREITQTERRIHQLAGTEFNVNSPKQLGEVLFDQLKLAQKPKKTRTGQYATDEQTLLALASEHEIVQRLLENRGATKLKSTYADALPATVWPKTGRIHTTFNQAQTSTGRLQSENPNLQNIPIRTERGKEIRKAFVPRGDDYVLLSADYSQIELRIIAALSAETRMIEAFQSGVDIHTATAARVFGVSLQQVTEEMRRKAKMVNYGIAYGISAFGLSQRLGIPRSEGAAIIGQYFAQFPGIRNYMSDTVAFARQHGYVQTVTGRRRYLRDIRSANATIRNAAERNAINMPIQGTAADMIKLAMVSIQRELDNRGWQTRMILQVHDELLFDLRLSEKDNVLPLVEEKMKSALVLDVPMVVEMGLGKDWLEAH